jgi:hypothetical protein
MKLMKTLMAVAACALAIGNVAQAESHVIGHTVEQITADPGLPLVWHEGNQFVWSDNSGGLLRCTFNDKGECVAVTFTFTEALSIQQIVTMVANEFGHINDFENNAATMKTDGNLHFRDAASDWAEYRYDYNLQKYLLIISRGDAQNP